ncbi:MAG: bifunctional UDP-3-O-[3-hydroxymyristoyl] N-acetylglucosamine deacetylase/3-hydroxyacyl-ACP dehydratase [Candidatus Delongbacteria bacterium]|nr:bifunctional UDP-3-O-[3-hydroxymyristoyl] N-acetylglucosamine deacetylase/3-hydroxyacyl-ACP dehydratase [Candidatus Delongbacteria bacterium]
MYKKQRTISHPTSISGVGLHTGEKCEATFHPAPENHGITFRLTDDPVAAEVLADIEHVVDISRGTIIAANGDAASTRFFTVEHVLSALAGLEIDNCRIVMTAAEPPVIDGSAAPFVELLEAAGIVEQEADREYLEIDRTIIHHDETHGIDIVAVPSDDFRITYMVDYQNPALGTQYTSMYSLQEEYRDEFSAARTFCFLSEVELLKEQNLIRGGTTENAVIIADRKVASSEFARLKEMFNVAGEVVIGESGILDNRPLRFVNEPVRHKVVDLIGDLALLGCPIKAHILAARAGHGAHVELVKLLRKELVKKRLTREYQHKLHHDYIFDAEAIERILPHRYPFLLIDRVLEMVPGESVTGIKNVTRNENFFEGHFPGRPVMPGVLIVEALGQAGGVLLLNTVEKPESKLVYFTTLNNIKFRQPVIPGDQLLLEVKMVKFRRNICLMEGRALVGDKVVAQAEMSAAIVEKP